MHRCFLWDLCPTPARQLLVTWTAEDASCYLSEPQLREIVIALLLFLLKNIVVIVVGWLLLLVCVCA